MLNVDGIAHSAIKGRPLRHSNSPDRCSVDGCLRDGEDVVAADDAVLGKALVGPYLHFRRMPRIVRVIGAQVTAFRTSMAASLVSTDTGRRPAVGRGQPSRCRLWLPRWGVVLGKPAGRLDQRRIGRCSSVGVLEFPIGLGHLCPFGSFAGMSVMLG